jgi:nucleotide-binding universal stress UspA family protein
VLNVDATSPILIAYDGSVAARDAVARAGELFPGRRAIVLTVWETGLGELMMAPDPMGAAGGMLPYDPAMGQAVTKAHEGHARDIAEHGKELASSLGLQAQALIVQDETVVADEIVTQADEHDVAVIVVGSRGLRGLKSMLLGSTSKHLIERSSRPVLVVRHPEDHEQSQVP